MKESRNFELAHLKKMMKGRNKKERLLGDFLVQYFVMLFCTVRDVVGHENTRR